MQLSRAEIAETHLIVTTPEKWDVVTRKATGADDDLATVSSQLPGGRSSAEPVREGRKCAY